MFELLKEMGKVCENRKVVEMLQDFHRRRFNDVYKINSEQAEAHQKQWAFWTEKLNDMNQHIQQLHNKLNNAA